MTTMTKAEVAKAAGVSGRTLRRWLNEPYMAKQLAPLKLKKQQKKLPPSAVQIICEHYVIEVKSEN